MKNLTVPILYNGKTHNLLFEGRYFFDRKFNATFPCVYIIVQQTPQFGNKIIYVGITEDINQRLENHHKIDCWRKYVTSQSLFILRQNDPSQRVLIESLVIQQYNPPCNG